MRSGRVVPRGGTLIVARVPLGPGLALRRQQFTAEQRSIVPRTAQDVNRHGPAGEQIVDVAFPIRHHRDQRRLGQPVRRDLGPRQPPARLLLIRRAMLPMRELARDAVHHDAVHQPDHSSPLGIHRQHRMQEQPQVLAVARRAKSPLARPVGGEMQLRRVLDRQHMATGRALPAQPSRRRQHLLRRHRGVGQKPAKPQRLIAVAGQPVPAQRPMPLHRRQQCLSNAGQPLVTKTPKTALDHANRTLCRIATRIDPGFSLLGNSFRTCAKPVAYAGLEPVGALRLAETQEAQDRQHNNNHANQPEDLDGRFRPALKVSGVRPPEHYSSVTDRKCRTSGLGSVGG